MFDEQFKQQLQTVFAKIEDDIQLVYSSSSHPDQNDLLAMLTSLAEINPHFKVVLSSKKSDIPQFEIHYDNKFTGVSFTGIPTGHEFSSLVLALLQTSGQAKPFEQNILKRVQALRGPIRLQTYISLTCENCPDVVQALNQMALAHADFQHQMIDGAYVQDEVQSLGIQGVPSVVSNNKLVHSGKIQLLDLLTKLESVFGTDYSAENIQPQNLGHYDVVVVGGGPAGVSAAIYSVRKGLKTAIIAEKMGGQVQDTKGIENFISVSYTEGPKLVGDLIQHLQTYPVEVFTQRRVARVEVLPVKKIILESAEFISADRFIFATGAKWRELGVAGEKEYIGRGVAFCPHCDGPYYKGKKIAVIGGGNSGVEAAIDLAGLVNELTVFEFQENLKADQVLVDKLHSLANVNVVTNAQTKAVIGDGQKVIALEYENRKTHELIRFPLDGIFVQIGLLPNSGFLKDVVDLTKFGEIIVDAKGRTSVNGIYAAGDVTTIPFKQIIIAMGDGAKVALTAFEDKMYGSPPAATE